MLPILATESSFSKMKYIAIFVFIFLNGIHYSFSQSKISAYQNEKLLIQKSKIALELWEYYSRYAVDSLNTIGFDLLLLNTNQKDPFVDAVANRLLGCYDVRSGSIKNGVKLLNKSKAIFLNINDYSLLSEAHNELGIAYLLMGDVQTAKSYFKNSLSIGKESSRSTLSYMAEINLAKCLLQEGDLNYSKRLTEHYIRFAETDEKFEAVANGYSLLGQIALDENKFKRAEKCFNSQLQYAQKTNAPFITTRAIGNQAILAFMSGDYEKSLLLFKKVLIDRQNQGFHAYTCDAYMNLANFYYQREQVALANDYVDSCFNLANSHALLSHQIEVLELKKEYFPSDQLANQLSRLYDDQKKLIQKNHNQRKSLNNKIATSTKNKSEMSYLYLLLACIPIVLWVIYRKTSE